MNTAELILALGGPTKVAQAVFVTTQAVCMWRQRDSIPPRHHARLWRLARSAKLAWQPPGMDSPAPAQPSPEARP